MTSATSRSNVAGRRGFSLVELLVVIGIILVIAGIALPMLIRAYSSADKSKAAADLQTIGIALEAYKNDFGDYPRPDGKGLGAAVLCKALVAPGPAAPGGAAAWSSTTGYNPGDIVDSGGTTYIAIKSTTVGAATSDTNSWTPYSDADGADGLGFRVRAGMGKPKPAYLQVDRIKVRGGMLTNKDGAPILYYPASLTKPNINAAPSATNGGYVSDPYQTSPLAQPLYHGGHNVGLLTTEKLRALLGDYSLDGWINPATESAVTGYNYLLVAAGPDGSFGPAGTLSPSIAKQAVAGCDDVFNFTRP